jgi:diadenosine tetraphosphate (Ap4A) HIT family hydrolase
MLVIPRRHASDYFSLNKDELVACHELIQRVREMVLSEDTTVTGFNVGVNIGAAAGQTILHCHFHLIPRRNGDVANPRGGIRNVIPGKGDYIAM